MSSRRDRVFRRLSDRPVRDKRFLARKTAFDIILGLILASIMARAVNGSEQLLPTLVASFLLAGLHRILGWMACRWPSFGRLIKGHSQTLIEDGKTDDTELRQPDEDLEEELRLNGLESRDDVRLARLEPGGDISVIKRQ